MNDLASKMNRRNRPAPAIVKAATQAGEDLDRLSIDIPAGLKRQLKIKAVQDGTTIRNIVIEALEDRLK